MTKSIEATDASLLSAIRAQKDDDPQYHARNKLYTKLLESYLSSFYSKDRCKKVYKLVFFIIVMLFFIIIISSCLISINNISIKETTTYADLGVIIASFSGILSALFVIPKIIAEHLFPSNEDSSMIDMVKNMQLNDTEIRNIIYTNSNKSDE